MKNFFGTPLLQMNQNTIRKLMKTNKFHQSNKLAYFNSKDLNILTLQNNTQINLIAKFGLEECQLEDKIQKTEQEEIIKHTEQSSATANLLLLELQKTMCMRCLLDGGAVPTMVCSN